jgi:DNA-binding response OmpR family regulator
MDRAETETAASLAGYRLLVVEDDYFVAQDLCTTLREHGAVVLGPAPNIASARSLAGALRPDCVLLDINLDGEHAFELARELRGRGMRIVFTTGYDSSFVPPGLRNTVCLQKPIDAAALLRSIRQQPPGTSPA